MYLKYIYIYDISFVFEIIISKTFEKLFNVMMMMMMMSFITADRGNDNWLIKYEPASTPKGDKEVQASSKDRAHDNACVKRNTV